MAEYLEWTDRWLSVCMSHLKEGGVAYVYGFPEILAHVAVRHLVENQRWLVWHYTNKAVPSSRFWQRSHESILCLWRGKRPELNIDAIREEYTGAYKRAIGKARRETKGRYNGNGRASTYNGHPKGALPRDVIKVPALAGGAGSRERLFLCKDCDRLCKPAETEEHAGHEVVRHPTQKPLALSEKLLGSVCRAGGRVLIPFAGSGSECVVAKGLEVDFFAAEINEDYVSFGRKWLAEIAGGCSYV